MINIFGLVLFIFNYFAYDCSVRGLLYRTLSVLVLKGQYHFFFFFLPRIATSSWHSPLKLSKLVPKIKKVQILLQKEAVTIMMLSIDRKIHLMLHWTEHTIIDSYSTRTRVGRIRAGLTYLVGHIISHTPVSGGGMMP